jgi:hypothetical protein
MKNNTLILILFSFLSIAPLLGMDVYTANAQKLEVLETEVAELRTIATANQERIRHSIDGFDGYDLLGKLNFTLDETIKNAINQDTMLWANSIKNRHYGYGSELSAMRQRIVQLTHEKAILNKAIEQMKTLQVHPHKKKKPRKQEDEPAH